MPPIEEVKEEKQEEREEPNTDPVADDPEADEGSDWDDFDEEVNSDDPVKKELEEPSIDEGDDDSDWVDSDWVDSEGNVTEDAPEEPEDPEAEKQEDDTPVVESQQEDAEKPEPVQDHPKDQNLEILDRLLSEMGYEGTPEEKLEKYKKENGISESAPETDEAPKTKEPDTEEDSGLDARAKRDLDTLSKAYPERLKGVKSLHEIPNFQNVIQKMVQTGCSMLDAYTSEIVEKEPSAKNERKKTQESGKSHLVGTQTTQRSGRFDPDTAEMRELKRNFYGYSEEKIRELYRKVQKNTR